jgi:hypothetical protein
MLYNVQAAAFLAGEREEERQRAAGPARQDGRPAPVAAPSQARGRLAPRAASGAARPVPVGEAALLTSQLARELSMDARTVAGIVAGQPGHRAADVDRVLTHLIQWHPLLTLGPVPPHGRRGLRQRRFR